ncbi:ribosomal RNA small subunit methyltransferase A [Candidatus Dojkabacteria bacterium]|nr:ribosomal RNA small subunit methyltransferase A [Candidatus Dojkabacteria bacterium]
MKALKYLGQNFLKDKAIIQKLVSIADPSSDQDWLEIGPGKGALTFELINLVQSLVCVERDPRLALLLKQKLELTSHQNFKVVNMDILNYNPADNFKNDFFVVGSLPYNISKKIIAKFITFPRKENLPHPVSLTFLVQKEVADDYTAKTPKSTFLSLFASIYSTCRYEFTVSAKSFSPVPKVDGAVIKFILKNPHKDGTDLSAFIKDCFQSQRKTIQNNLLRITPKKYHFRLKQCLKENNFKIVRKKRPEELSLEEFQKVFMLYNNVLNNEEKTD